jgi:hypothetical protein
MMLIPNALLEGFCLMGKMPAHNSNKTEHIRYLLPVFLKYVTTLFRCIRYTASNRKMIVNEELRGMWKEAVVTRISTENREN